ncbi:MAG: branched-chain amino acid ABC transporter permease [Alphaproteobacteria bacterium]
MELAQVLANGIVLGALYACIAVGFSLVWGVLNIINMMHGTFIILGGYIAYFAFANLGVHPFVMMPVSGLAMFALGYVLQRGVINRVIAAPVLTTLTLTFGLDMLLYNFITVAWSATPRRITLELGQVDLGGVLMPLDRIAAFGLALLLTGALFVLLRTSRTGRAIVAVRMDRDAARLMGIRVNHIYAMTFGIGAFMAGATGALLAVIFPVTPNLTALFLGKAFVVCVIGGLGGVPGALVGGLVLGLIESFAGHWLGPQHMITAGFVLMLLLLLIKPTGLVGRKGYE